MIDLRLPNITGGSSAEQMAQMQSYMYQLVQQLNWALNSLDSGSFKNRTAGDVLAFAEDCKAGVHSFTTDDSSTNIPSGYTRCSGLVFNRTEDNISVFLINHMDGTVTTNYKSNSSVWSGWKYFTPSD